MKTKTLGFIGGGRITRIFLQAFANRHIDFGLVVVCDTNLETLKQLKNQFPKIQTTDAAGLAAEQDIVFIALHPPVIMETLEKIRPDVSGKTTVISLAPKITMAGIAGKLEAADKIIRLIPNATSVINEGYNPVCFSSDIPQREKSGILDILSVLGETFEVSESKLESYAIVSAMAPTYFWFQWAKLVKIGVETGLSEAESEMAVEKTMVAALNTQFKSELGLDEVLDLIPVKPIGEHENEISRIYSEKLIELYNKIKS